MPDRASAADEPVVIHTTRGGARLMAAALAREAVAARYLAALPNDFPSAPETFARLTRAHGEVRLGLQLADVAAEPASRLEGLGCGRHAFELGDDRHVSCTRPGCSLRLSPGQLLYEEAAALATPTILEPVP